MEIKKIINLYKHIDNEIDKLHDLSNNDFKTLNTLFKSNYNKSKQFFEYQQEILNEIQRFIPVSLSGNQVNEREFSHLSQTILKRVINIEKSLDKSEKLFEKILVPVKNYKQNILTINFIISQLNILSKYVSKHESEKQNSLKALFNELTGLFSSFSAKVDVLNKHIELGLQKTQEFKKLQQTLIEKYSKVSKSIAEFTKEKQVEIDDYCYRVNFEEIIREQYNEIIINLQYHDIIRQKMDHVQETYKEFLIEYIDKENNQSETESSILPYLANLAELQSAQLAHVNKKYQEAIISINKSISKISDEVNNQSGNVNSLLKAPDAEVFPEAILAKLKSVQLSKTSIANGIAECESIIGTLATDMNNCITDFKLIKQKNAVLVKWIKEIIFEGSSKSILNENLYLQLINVSNDTARLAKEINNHLLKNDDIINNTNSQTLDIERNLNMYIDNFSDYLKIYIEVLDNIQHKNQLTTSVITEIDAGKENSASTLKYYGYFENAIQGIIEELSLINDQAVLKGMDMSPELFRQEMANIKKHYTMKSELLIHNNLENIKTDQILTDIEEDDNQVEFF